MKKIMFVVIATIGLAKGMLFAHPYLKIDKSSDGRVIFGCNREKLPHDLLIPKGISKIRMDAFSNCNSLSNVTIPKGVTEIGKGAFKECASLKCVVIPEGVTEIADRTFSGCQSLTNIAIPASITKIHTHAFENCTNIKEIHYDGTLAQFCEILYIIDYEIKEHKHLQIYNGFLAFEDVFEATIHCSDGIYKTEVINGMKKIGSIVYGYTDDLPTIVTIPNGVSKIGLGAFYSSSLKNIMIPESVTEIGENAFSLCYYLTNIIIPASITKIGIGAFKFCKSLKEVNYGGTKAQFINIKKNRNIGNGLKVNCSDGVVMLD